MSAAFELHGCCFASHAVEETCFHNNPGRSVENHCLWLFVCSIRVLLKGVAPPPFAKEAMSSVEAVSSRVGRYFCLLR